MNADDARHVLMAVLGVVLVVSILWDAFETNYTHGKYQFAFLA